ncbi:MAG TPA: nucleoside 2-deoxyribosyltransferase [Acidimicrobiia bacterium]|nr:nucleoside 2-deoxyribosyltransferase [Acidimicrobiia bacterium]
MRLYFAGPLFSVQEREFNMRLAASIEALGFDVFLPQRDGYEGPKDPEVIRRTEVAQEIFQLDKGQVLACDVLLCILDGRVPDEGMAVEMGLAYADRLHRNQSRVMIGLSTDFLRGGTALNPMLVGALDEIYSEETALLERLGEIIRE